ncbi:MAG: hypothetical protein AB8F78_09845 [Saprospiraceae bacterium]
MSFPRLLFGASLLLVLAGCQSDVPTSELPVEQVIAAKPDTRPATVKSMETALGVDDYFEFAGVTYKLNLIFGGTPRFKGAITQTGNMDRIRLEQTGETMVFDGKQVHIKTGGMLDTRSARFNALTWPYFFSLPFKLADPGTQLEPMSNQTVDGVEFRRAKLTFSKGTGDAPDDWYILYFDAEDRLAAAAYIVTFGGKSMEDALANAHAIRYLDYEEEGGILFSRKWTFHDWSESEGWTKQIGEAGVYDISLLSEISQEVFAIPEGSIATGAPQ